MSHDGRPSCHVGISERRNRAPVCVQDVLEMVCIANSDVKIIAYPTGKRIPVEIKCKDLLAIAKRNCRKIRNLPMWRRDSVIMIHIRDQLNAIIWFWSVLYAGNIPAISTALSNNSTQRLEFLRHMSHTLKQPICITSEHELEQFNGQTFMTPTTIESMAQDLDTENEDWSHPMPRSNQEPALLMFTSGSTSNAKAVCLSHQQLIASIYGKSTVVDLPEGTTFMNWIAMDHVASIVEIHLAALYMGRDQVHVEGSDVLTDPTYFLDLIDRHRVSRTFAPNFFLAKLKAALQQRSSPGDWDLSCLRFVASGGEANSTDVCKSLMELLEANQAQPNTIIAGFGMTETCAGSIYNVNCPRYELENGLEFLSLGHCMPGIEMRITGADGCVPADVAGNLEVRGSVVFKEYFNNPVASAAAFTEDGWFKTGDQGVIDASGYLRLIGRTKDVIILNGVKYSPNDVETALEEAEIPGVTPGFIASFSKWSSQLETEEIHILYLPSYSVEDNAARLTAWKAINKEVLLVTGARPAIIPVDETILQKSSLGKLSRGKLKIAFEKGELGKFVDEDTQRLASAKASIRKNPVNHIEESVLSIFTDILDVSTEDFDVETPFFDAGITSIQLIQLKRRIKEGLHLTDEIPITTLISHPTVRSLTAELERLTRAHEYEPIVTLQPEGDRTPLWLIHPGVGEVLVFMALAKYVTKRKVFALRARGFNAGESYFKNIEEAVSTYYKSIKQRQPKGPYAIAGYSYGTMLAFEVAKVLENYGDKVAFCGSFNLPPHIKTRMQQLDWNNCIMHLCYFLRLFDEQHGQKLADESRLHNDDRAQILEKVVRDADQNRLAELSLTPEDLANWASLAYSLQSMATEYEPDGLVDSMDVFYCTPLAIVASSREEWRHNHLSKWSGFTRSQPRFHEVQGEHYTMLDPDNVFSFQQTLNKVLKARGL